MGWKADKVWSLVIILNHCVHSSELALSGNIFMVLGQVEGVLWLVFFDHKEKRVIHASLLKKQKEVFIMCLILQQHECGQGVNSKVLVNTSFFLFLISCLAVKVI